MKLSELFDGINGTDGDREITDICSDSRDAKENSLFFCISGQNTDGHKYASDAYLKGCRVFCAEKELNLPGDAVILRSVCTRKTMAETAAKFYSKPCESLFTIAITGTKGKTSSAYMIKKILESSGRRVGLIGTLGIVYGSTVIRTPNTTPESTIIHKYCREMLSSRIDTVIFEVSSQSLKQYRTHGIGFDIAVFTNLSPDHIGGCEHADYDEYRECKKRLFSQCKAAFFNSDDDEYGYMSNGVQCEKHTFGMKDGAEYRAENAAFSLRDGIMKSEYECDGTFITTNYPGRPGVYNSLCAFAVCDYMKIDRYLIASSLESVSVNGRCETVTLPCGSTVIIDYAHNRLSVNELFSSITPYADGRIFTVFGCGGERSEERRTGMGSVIAERSDVAVITTDNPRSEKLSRISRDIRKGVVRPCRCRFKTIYDRRKAIWYCLKKAQKKDIVLVIGKGHEDYMEIGKKKYHYNDGETVRSLAERLRGN